MKVIAALVAGIVLGGAGVAVAASSDTGVTTRGITLRQGDVVFVNALFWDCSYSRPLGRRALACAETGDPSRALNVIVFRDRILLQRGSRVLYRAYR